jgi:hypothetical protein
VQLAGGDLVALDGALSSAWKDAHVVDKAARDRE